MRSGGLHACHGPAEATGNPDRLEPNSRSPSQIPTAGLTRVAVTLQQKLRGEASKAVDTTVAPFNVVHKTAAIMDRTLLQAANASGDTVAPFFGFIGAASALVFACALLTQTSLERLPRACNSRT